MTNMRVAPGDIEMQIRFLIALLSNIDDKLDKHNEGAKHSESRRIGAHGNRQSR